MKVQVLVRLKEGVLDVQGKAVENSIHSLGYQDIEGVRIGKLIELEIKDSEGSAEDKLKEVCDKLLSNPIIEDYEIKNIA